MFPYHFPTIIKRWLAGMIGAGIVLGFIALVVKLFGG